MSLGALSRAAALQQLTAQSGPRNTFLTNHKLNKYGGNFENGLFTWEKEVIYFDFYNTGKIRRITIPMDEFYAHDIGELAPSRSDSRWGLPRYTAMRTEYIGDAHRRARTSIAEQAAWNVVNAWCSTYRVAGAPLELMMLRARDAYARVTTDQYVVFFQGGPELLKPHYGAEVFDRNKPSEFHYVNWTQKLLEDSALFTPEQKQYVMVAKDAALEGRTDMPLHGLGANLRFRTRGPLRARRDGAGWEEQEPGPLLSWKIIEALPMNLFLVRVSKRSELLGPYQVVHRSGLRLAHGGDLDLLRDFAVLALGTPELKPAWERLKDVKSIYEGEQLWVKELWPAVPQPVRTRLIQYMKATAATGDTEPTP